MLTLLGIVLLAVINLPARAEVIRLTVGEWPPYISQELKHNGLASHIISEAFAVAGIEVQHEFLPWGRAMTEATAGNSHGTHSLFHSEERAERFHFSDPVLTSEYVFFHLNLRRFDWREFEDLRGMSVGTVYGYYYGDDFAASQQGNVFQTTSVSDDSKSLKMLFRKRVDLVPIDPLVGYYLIHQHFQPHQAHLFTNHPQAFNSQPTYLLLSKTHPDSEALIKRFNAGLQQLKNSGRLEQMVEDLISGKYN